MRFCAERIVAKTPKNSLPKRRKVNLLYLDDDKLVAGAILKIQDNNLYIYRIFVDSTEFHKGHGLGLMKAIEEKFSTVNKYYLDTPEWNIRTNNFYKKCGYTVTGKEHTPDFDLIIFEKVNENAIS